MMHTHFMLGTQGYKHTLSVYVIIIAFPLLQQLHRFPSILCYMSCLRYWEMFYKDTRKGTQILSSGSFYQTNKQKHCNILLEPKQHNTCRCILSVCYFDFSTCYFSSIRGRNIRFCNNLIYISSHTMHHLLHARPHICYQTDQYSPVP
jgi:hypothetical protein